MSALISCPNEVRDVGGCLKYACVNGLHASLYINMSQHLSSAAVVIPK